MEGEIRRWHHPRRDELLRLAHTDEINSNSIEIDPSYNFTIENPGPQPKQQRPATPLIELPSRYREK